MGDIHKIGDEYYIEFYARGLKYQQKAGPDRTYAEKLLREIETKIARGEMGTMVRDVDRDIFFKDFLDYAKTQYPLRTVQRYQKAIEHFDMFLNQRFSHVGKLSGFTPHVFEQYKIFLTKEAKHRNKEISPKMINLTLILWREVCEYARKIGYLNDNPLLHIKFLPAKSRTLNYLTDEELNLILAKAKPELSFVVVMLVSTGLNQDELLQLQWSHIDWQNQHLQLEKSISSQPRIIPLNLRLVELLKKRMKEKTSFHILGWPQGHSLAKELMDLGKGLLGGKKLTFYTLRHTFARQILKKSISLSALAKILGFTDMARAMIYFCFLLEKKDEILSSSPYSIS